MKKLFTLVLALVGLCSLNAKTIYLNTGGSSLWNQSGAVFFTHSWGSGSDSDIKMTHVTGDIYSSEIPDGDNSIIFVRMPNGSSSLNWDDKWNGTGDLTIPSGKNCYTITDWDPSSNDHWSSYTPPTPEDPTAKYYITGDSALVVDAGLDESKAWNTKAIKSEADSRVLSLKAGVNYKLKVVTTAEDWLGYYDLTTTPAGVYKDGDGNICFSLTAAGNVTVTYTASPAVFTITGSFYVKPVTKRTITFVPSEEWMEADAKFAAWIWGSAIESQWTSFFTPVNVDKDTFQVEINADADSIDFVRFSPKASAPTWTREGENIVVWNEMKDKLYADSSTWTVIDWTKGQWKTYDRPCQEFGLVIDGVYHKAKHNVNQTEWLEYMLRGVELTAGQKLQIRNNCPGGADWVITKFSDTSFEFEIQDGKYVVAESGKYDFYFKFIYENDEIFVAKEGTWTTAVRPQCTDVMIQAFYNESYNASAPGVSEYGDTKWTTLLEQADALGEDFDLIWLPPSANGSGMGYHPKKYSDQNSNWGSQEELIELIGALHSAGSRVIADIVINHCEGWTTWCDFPELDFGTYGKFNPDCSWICKNDEVNSDPSSPQQGAATGSYDDGENWAGARDWAHDMPKVQEMFKAYLKWMKNVIGYDGWRYDKGDGFNNWHHDNYNKASGPYIAFMECYSGTDEIQSRIAQANSNLMGLDFDIKWHVFNSIAGWDYSHGRGDCMMSRGDGYHAVTFMESHDWFLRSDNENEFGGRGHSMTEEMKPRLLQCNAFLLSMPGVPCIFYPHWKKYREFIKPMIQARKLAGVHSQSEVKDEYVTATGYQATIVGKDDGYLIFCLGDKAHQDFSSAGYECKASYYAENDCSLGHDASFQMWVKPKTSTDPTAVEEVEEQLVKAEKFFQNGQLFIRLGDKVYNVLGNTIK